MEAAEAGAFAAGDDAMGVEGGGNVGGSVAVDWDDRLSWEDSERFDGDSLCSSPYSDSESLCQNWRGWSGPSVSAPLGTVCSYKGGICTVAAGTSNCSAKNAHGPILSLVELSAKQVAKNIPFEAVERFHLPVPETLQLRIAYWSFPDNEEDVRLYSCLANGNVDEFHKGETLFRNKSVENLLQIGFHLSATVLCPAPSFNIGRGGNSNLPSSYASNGAGPIKCFNVAVTLDRCKITSCTCTCNPNVSWCAHVVALCLHRIHMPSSVCFRAPLSESLSRLHRDQLQKFAQYLISELPRHFLPTAQKLLDSLLSQTTKINDVCGAPDPTAGASVQESANWCLEEATLHENIRKILHKFCQPTPTVCDVNYLSSNAPPAASEWQTLLRPLRGREPEGLWNLLSIVHEMYRRHDSNAVSLLHIITQECLACDQVILWWFHTKLSQSLNAPQLFINLNGNKPGGIGGHMPSAQYSCATLFDEIVSLWRLAVLNPMLTSEERTQIYDQLRQYHVKAIEKVCKIVSEYQFSRKTNNNHGNAGAGGLNGPPVLMCGPGKLTLDNIRFDLDSFPGFLSALEVCVVDWTQFKLIDISLFERPATTTMTSLVSLTKSCFSFSSSSSSTILKKDGGGGGGGLLLFSKNNLVLNLEKVSKASTSSTKSSAVVESPLTSTPRDEIEKLYMLDPSDSTDGNELLEYNNNNNNNGGAGGSVKPKAKSSSELAEEALSFVRPIDDSIEISFAQCEGLHAHGFTKESCQLAVRLANQLLDNPPDLMIEIPPPIISPQTSSSSSNMAAAGNGNGNNGGTPNKNVGGGRKKKKCSLEVQYLLHPKAMQVSLLATSTLSKVLFLFDVLYREKIQHKLAFRLALWALELPRQPAASKFLEVKLHHQEQEIVNMLKELELGQEEMNMLRESALKFRSGAYRVKPLPVLPLSLATYLFECLCGGKSNASTTPNPFLLPKDEQIGFESAVAALSLKCNVAESDHPLLCEGTRRQRGELALALLLRYKDDSTKIAMIMDQLLDAEMHQMYKHHASNALPFVNVHSTKSGTPTTCAYVCSAPPIGCAALLPLEVQNRVNQANTVVRFASVNLASNPTAVCRTEPPLRRYSNPQNNFEPVQVSDADVSNMSDALEEMMLSEENRDDDSNPYWYNRINLGNRPVGESPGDGASSASSSSGVSRGGRQPIVDVAPVPASLPVSANVSAPASPPPQNSIPKSVDPLNKTCYLKIARLRKYVTPNIPNQPSEAHAHFMNELAKRLLTEAGGNHSTAIFTTPQGGAHSNPSSAGGPHRALHLCAFQIGLYALGLHNKVTPNWLSRTYSSHVSWISGQAMEIGRTAIRILIDSWENHLTPTEVANLADKGSQSRDAGMVLASAELALSALPQAHALNPTDIQRALAQCKEQNTQMLIKACLAVEQAAKDGGVYPEVLFKVAQQWSQLYSESTGGADLINAESQVSQQVVQQNTPILPHHFHHHHHHLHPGARDRVLNVNDVQQQQQIIFSADMTQFAPPPAPPPPHTHRNIQFVANAVDVNPQSMVGSPMVAANQFIPRPPGVPNVYGLPNGLPVGNAAAYGVSQVLTPFPPVFGAPNQQPIPFPHMIRAVLPPAPPLPGMLPFLVNPAVAAQQYINLPPNCSNAQPRLHAPPHHVSFIAVPSQMLVDNVQHHHHQQQQREQGNTCYLYAAYRVGMLAMETMGRRIHDERSYVKYTQNPPYGDDVKWLLKMSRKLGMPYVQQFCMAAVQSVVSPFVLWDLATETAYYFSRASQQQNGGGMTPANQQMVGVQSTAFLTKALTHPCVQPLMQRCVQMFYAAAHQKLSHPRFMQSDAEEVCTLVRAACMAFQCTGVNSSENFNAFLQSLRRQKACKKELWNKLLNILSV